MFGNLPTTGPLAPIVGLERRALEQRGVAPGQEQQGSAAAGTPISGDLARLIQLNRMIQQQGAMQQQANPAPTTVAQDLMQLAMQQRAPQMPPQMDPRAQGVANLPAGDIGTRYMAGGGIVAFDDGGSVHHFDGLDGSLVGGLLDPGYGQDNVLSRALREEAEKEVQDKLNKERAKQATVEAAVKRGAQPGGGLSEFVPTLTGGRISPIEAALKDSQISAEHPLSARLKEREAMEDKYGLTAIRKAREAEMERRMKELSPEAQRNAFLDNLSAAFASQIGQRGVSTSTRLAQMLGAYGTTKAQTAEQFKKSTADLNAAKLDMQEKQATARMTGELSDRAAATAAQKAYIEALQKREDDRRQAARDAETAKYRQAELDYRNRALRGARTSIEEYGSEVRDIRTQLGKARDEADKYPAGTPQRTAADAKVARLQEKLDETIDIAQRMSPGAVGAFTRQATDREKIELERLKLLNTNTEYRRLKTRLQGLNSKKNPENKTWGPEEYEAERAKLQTDINKIELANGIPIGGVITLPVDKDDNNQGT